MQKKKFSWDETATFAVDECGKGVAVESPFPVSPNGGEGIRIAQK